MRRSSTSVIVVGVSSALGLFGCASDDADGNVPNATGASGSGAAQTAGAAAASGGSVGASAGTAAAGSGAGTAAAGSGAGAGAAMAGTGGVAAGDGAGAGGSSGAGAGHAGESSEGAGQAGGTGAPAMDADAGLITASDAGTSQPPVGGTCLQGNGDFSQDGPYDVELTTVTIASSGDFTIYIPDPLEENCPHPMVAWGNGTTVSGGTAYRHFNERMASWGIVAIASHDDGTASSGPRIGDGSFHRAAIDYLLEQNEDPTSRFYGKLSGRAGVSGHSQGGGGGNAASSHPNVEANGNVQGAGARSGQGVPEGVAFLCLTGTEDLATEGCLTAVNSVSSSPAMYASYDGMTHTATLSGRSDGSQQYARLLSAWFRCFLADDIDACAMFMGGDSCPLCQEPGWDNIFVTNY